MSDAGTMTRVLRLDGVWTAFDRGWVLEDVSLSVAEGEIAAVVGGGGQGKTTLIRLATGTLPADRGRVLVNGIDVAGLRDRDVSHMLASDIGVATGVGPALGLTVRDYIETRVAAPKDRVWRWWWRRRWGRREQRRMTAAVLDEPASASARIGSGTLCRTGSVCSSNWRRRWSCVRALCSSTTSRAVSTYVRNKR